MGNMVVEKTNESKKAKRAKNIKKAGLMQKALIEDIKKDEYIKSFKNAQLGKITTNKCKMSKKTFARRSSLKKMLIDILMKKYNASRIDVTIAISQ